MCDFFKFLINLPTSIGEVFTIDKSEILSILLRFGETSVCPSTVDFLEKLVLKISLLCFGSLIISPFSFKGDKPENLLFYVVMGY